MFIGRSRELEELNNSFSDWTRKTAVLIYGKKRVGKSTLIKEAAKSFNGVVINHLCISSSFEGGANALPRSSSAF